VDGLGELPCVIALFKLGSRTARIHELYPFNQPGNKSARIHLIEKQTWQQVSTNTDLVAQ